MNTLSVWLAVGLLCMLMCHALAEPTACLLDSDPACRDATNTAVLNGVQYCCPKGAGSISTSSSNINGVQTDSCKCGVPIKMPKMPTFHWPNFHNPFPWRI